MPHPSAFLTQWGNTNKHQPPFLFPLLPPQLALPHTCFKTPLLLFYVIHLERWQKSKATSQNNTVQKQQMKEQQDSPTSSYLVCCVTFPFPKPHRTPNYQLSLGTTWGCLPILLPAWIKKIASRRIKFRAFSQQHYLPLCASPSARTVGTSCRALALNPNKCWQSPAQL